MRIPEQVKSYYRYYRILRGYKVKGLNEYVRMFSPNSPVRVLDLLPFKPEIIFDVGANEGQWTKSYYNIIGDKAKFYLFEPVPSLYERLREAFKTFKNIYVYDLALSSEKGFKNFNIAQQTDFSSFEKINETRLNLNCPELGIHFIGQIQVKIDTLDNFYSEHIKTGHIDILKLDVQGHELPILENGVNALEHIKSILIEWNIINLYDSESDFINTHQFLTGHNFMLSSIPFQYRVNYRLLYADVLYLNRKLNL